MPFQAACAISAGELATDADASGSAARTRIEAYGKGAIVGDDGELEHGAVWHEAGGAACARCSPGQGDRAGGQNHRRASARG